MRSSRGMPAAPRSREPEQRVGTLLRACTGSTALPSTGFQTSGSRAGRGQTLLGSPRSPAWTLDAGEPARCQGGRGRLDSLALGTPGPSEDALWPLLCLLAAEGRGRPGGVEAPLGRCPLLCSAGVCGHLPLASVPRQDSQVGPACPLPSSGLPGQCRAGPDPWASGCPLPSLGRVWPPRLPAWTGDRGWRRRCC